MDKLLSLLPIASKARTAPLAPLAALALTRAEDIAIQEWKAWCKKLDFKEGGKYLLGDYMDEGKLLLFIKNEVASRVSWRGHYLNAEKERKSKGKGKRRADTSALPVLEGEDDESCSDLVLIYNTVRGYCSAINEFWASLT
ncbi:hypothetical protein NA56DRAFT_647295 [Hyaloscypha hepaticicola]|uniref:Uncharacterized protein n=1 Tax=Hyaloscypha hepaticicola TaxID=2082293 RepID=A0A2J6PYW9_9HELO|nr:hypothetical protein NA56DRAFT_647295 [Hyaloscypha hepaticicola]